MQNSYRLFCTVKISTKFLQNLGGMRNEGRAIRKSSVTMTELEISGLEGGHGQEKTFRVLAGSLACWCQVERAVSTITIYSNDQKVVSAKFVRDDGRADREGA